MLIGLVLGIGVVTAFVFLGSESTIDAPGIEGTPHTQTRAHAPHGSRHQGHRKHRPQPSGVATVPVEGGAPPASGPVQLHYRQGDLVRLRVVSDATVGLQLPGYGFTGTVAAGRPALIRFTAAKVGNFSLIVATSHIAVAEISVGR